MRGRASGVQQATQRVGFGALSLAITGGRNSHGSIRQFQIGSDTRSAAALIKTDPEISLG